jgi:hypothetical protein
MTSSSSGARGQARRGGSDAWSAASAWRLPTSFRTVQVAAAGFGNEPRRAPSRPGRPQGRSRKTCPATVGAVLLAASVAAALWLGLAGLAFGLLSLIR